MGALEDLLNGLGSIVSGLINTVLALVNGVIELASTIVFGIITFFTSLLHAVFTLFANITTFVWANMALILVLGVGYWAYVSFIAPSQPPKRRVNTGSSRKKIF